MCRENIQTSNAQQPYLQTMLSLYVALFKHTFPYQEMINTMMLLTSLFSVVWVYIRTGVIDLNRFYGAVFSLCYILYV